MSEAAPISVFIVTISTKGLYPFHRVGPCFATEEKAAEEVKRLQAANSYTVAKYVRRQLGE